MLSNEKINNKIVKSILKGEKVMYQIIDNDYWVAPSVYNAFRLPKKEMLIDTSFMTETTLLTDYVCDYEYTKATDINTIIQASKKDLQVLKNDNSTAYVDRKLLKDFDKCDFYIKANLAPVLVKNRGLAVGLVMPVRPPREV